MYKPFLVPQKPTIQTVRPLFIIKHFIGCRRQNFITQMVCQRKNVMIAKFQVKFRKTEEKKMLNKFRWRKKQLNNKTNCFTLWPFKLFIICRTKIGIMDKCTVSMWKSVLKTNLDDVDALSVRKKSVKRFFFCFSSKWNIK